jgi:hypothetical protein
MIIFANEVPIILPEVRSHVNPFWKNTEKAVSRKGAKK